MKGYFSKRRVYEIMDDGSALLSFAAGTER